MKRNLFIYLLLGITLLAFLIRFIKLGSIPPSPNWDEVALGYNAYSLIETGRDEYGKFLPVVLRSFDDYKPALYTYLVIPFYLLFGLSSFAVRFPSMLFGTITVFASFFLVKEIFGKEKISLLNYDISSKTIAVVSSFLLAISPWHIQFSRIAFESNVGVAFNVLGSLFFLKGLKTQWLLLLSAFFFGVCPSIYQSDKVFTPLLVLALVIIHWKSVWKLSKVYLVSAVVVGVLALLPMIYFHATDVQALARAQGVSVFSNQTEFLKENAIKNQINRENGDVLGLFFDNRRVEYVKAVISGYIAHFDLNWLFISGDIARHHAPNMGLLYLFEFPFLLIGLYCLIFGRFSKSAKFTVMSWFLLAPVPAMITSGVPHAVRTLNFLPMFQIVIAIGAVVSSIYVLKLIKSGTVKRLIGFSCVSVFLIIALFNVTYYLNQYFVQLNYETSQEWLYGYEQAIAFVKPIEHKYDKIVVSNQPPLDQSYMFFLFYLQYPPSTYQQDSQLASGGFRENHRFGKYEFRPIEWNKEEISGKTLYIGRPGDFPDGVEQIYTGRYLDGSKVIVIVEK